MKKKKNYVLGNAEISAFCSQMSMIVSAGIPVPEGISLLLDTAPNSATKEILSSISLPLEGGATFHQAMEQSGHFPKYVLDMIEIGELSGKLEEVLTSLSRYYEREESIRTATRNAITYPLFMVAVMFSILIVLLTKVLPVFQQIYVELGSSLTGPAAGALRISSFINQYMLYLLLALFLLAIGGFFFARSPFGRRLKKKTRLAHFTAASRFANCMYLAQSSGLTTEQGLALAGQLVDHPEMELKIQRCSEQLALGTSFSDALFSCEIFDSLYASFLTVGMKTGTIDEVMNKISEEYEQMAVHRLSRLISVLEPTLVILLSVFIGVILLSFLMPLIGIMSSIG